jgi:hypothetical protein
MLNNTHPIAGRRIPTRIKPLASLSAIVAISCHHDRNIDEDGGDIQKRRKKNRKKIQTSQRKPYMKISM